MGFLKGKKKTSVVVETKKMTLSKIVKFTYLQSLAVDGSLTTAGEVGGESESLEYEDPTGAESSASANTVSKMLSKDRGTKRVPNLLRIILGPTTSAAIQSLFGKKVKSNTKVDVKESGWTLTKTWNQPQFDIIKYAVGIKDLNITQFTYEETSEVVSIPWRSPKEVIKVLVTVDHFIPSVFPTGHYIKYYVKPNLENAGWVQINPLGQPSVFQEDGSIVPRIINFNTEQPLSSRLEESYITTETPVKEVRFRAVLSRPTSLEGTTASADGYTPILRSYRLLMTPKNGL